MTQEERHQAEYQALNRLFERKAKEFRDTSGMLSGLVLRRLETVDEKEYDALVAERLVLANKATALEEELAELRTRRNAAFQKLERHSRR
jgi:hypothetical protein